MQKNIYPNRDEHRALLEAADKKGAAVDEAMVILEDFARTIHDLREANRFRLGTTTKGESTGQR